MSSHGVEIRRLSPKFGAEVLGVDLRSELSEAQTRSLRAAWHERALLLFRNQELDDERQMAVCSLFGSLSDAGPIPMARQFYISNVDPDGHSPHGELAFHSDLTFVDAPLRGLALYALEVVPGGLGGETLFANVGLAYELLPANLKERIADLDIVHSRPDQTKFTAIPGPDPSPNNPSARHPLTLLHPVTGKKLLFCSPRHFDRIVGLGREEGLALAQELASYIDRPEVIYKHSWRVGDFLLMDNLQLQHARTAFDRKYRRHIRRTQIGAPATVPA